MKDYVETICSYFNNLKGYMEKEEIVELLNIMEDYYNYGISRTSIENALTDKKLEKLNIEVENSETTNFYIDLFMILRDLWNGKVSYDINNLK